MSPLHPVCAHAPGETPASFVSNLARLHHVSSARRFSRQMGFSFQGVVDGDPATLEEVHDLTGAALEPLRDAAIRRTDGNFSWRGQALTKAVLRRDRLHVCPACLAEDVERSPHPPECSMHGRTTWMLGHVTTCPVHSLPLVEVARRNGPRAVHDFAALLAPVVGELHAMVERAPQRACNGTQTYLLRRLEEGGGGPAFLDGLDWHAAARACDVLGAVEVGGRDVALSALRADEWETARDAGFAIASGGEAGIADFLDRLQRTHAPSSKANDGVEGAYGTLNTWLAHEGGSDAAFEPLRDIVRRHAVATVPLGAGAEALGRTVAERLVHSIRTASLETGIHPKRLRKLLSANALIPRCSDAIQDGLVRFDAAAAQPVLASAVASITQKALGPRINAGRSQVGVLVGEGFLVPISRSEGMHPRFETVAVDAFMARLLGCAGEGRRAGLHGLPSAAKRANCGIGEILRLVLGGALTSVALDPDERGFQSVLVDPEEVKEHVRGEEVDGMATYKVAKRLGTTAYVVQALIDEKALPAEVRINPQNRCPTQFVMSADLDLFERTYVTLFQLAEETGRHHVGLNADLRARGLFPAFDPAVVRTTIYRRADIPPS